MKVWAAALVCVAAVAATVRSQTATAVTVHGVAYDSLRGAPLGGAFITIVGGSRSATTDARGRFQFDGLTPGTYQFAMQHDALDSIGVTGLSTRAVVSDGRDTVRISIRSFAGLWRSACGTDAPKDSGFVFGTVRGGDGKPAAGATIAGSWIDIALDKSKTVTQQRWRLEVRSDESGEYRLCGVPTNVGLRLQAIRESAESGLIDLLPREIRMQRRDLALGAVDSRSVAHGVIAGVVTAEGGQGVAGARVTTDGAAEMRSDANGHFLIRDVRTGTRQVDVLAIGMVPVSAVVDVTARDTATVAVEVRKVTTLDPVKVKASSVRQRIVADIAERKKSGFGHFADSTTIAAHGRIQSVFEEMPNVRATAKGVVKLGPLGPGQCTANVWIDGFRSDSTDTAWLRPDEVAVVEVYSRMLTTPPEFIVRNPRLPPCGSVVIWTKRIMP